MKPEKLLNEIGQIDESIITEADTNTITRKSVKRIWLRLATAAAACVIVVAGIVALYNHNLAPIESEFPDLPMLTVSKDSGSFGFEGYLAYDISELKNGNPWSENFDIKTLPLFQNPASYDNAGHPVKGLSSDEMIQIANETALLLELTVDSVYTNPTEEDLKAWREKERSIPGNEGFEPDATPYEAVAICGDVTIKVEANGLIRVFFENGVTLPDEYSFPVREEYYTTERITQDPNTGDVYSEKEERLPDGNIRPDYNAEMEQAENTLSYLLNAYQSVVNMKSPAIDLFGDYNIYGQLSISHRAYEGHGDLLDKMLGYNFNWVRFASNDEGDLWIIDRCQEELSQKIGDYPIISAKEARELLLNKHYITTVPEEFPGADYIASVELIYRTGRYDEVFMPYYRFLVELPSMSRDNGLKDFGAYYVPAVEGMYLTNMPLWDGSFN